MLFITQCGIVCEPDAESVCTTELITNISGFLCFIIVCYFAYVVRCDDALHKLDASTRAYQCFFNNNII